MYNVRVTSLIFYFLFFTMAHLSFSVVHATNKADPVEDKSAESTLKNEDSKDIKESQLALIRTEALKLSVSSPMIIFNRALEYAKQQNFGLALAYLREVRLLAPRHLATRQAIRYVEHQLLEKGIRQNEDFWDAAEASFLSYFMLPEILMFHLIFTLILFLVITKFYRVSKRAKLQQEPPPIWSKSSIGFIVFWSLATLILITKMITNNDIKATVISASKVPLFSGPVSDAAQITEVPEGTLLNVNNIHDEWIQVSRQDLPMGWILKDHLLILTSNGFK